MCKNEGKKQPVMMLINFNMHFDKKYLYSKSHVLYQGKKVFYQGAAKCAGNGEKFEDK